MAIYLVYFLMLFGFISIAAARITLTLYALHLGADPSAVGILLATFFIFPLVLSWPLGLVSDRFGSRWLLVFGALITVFGILIPYFWQTLAALYMAGLLVGASFAFYTVLLQNMIGLLSTAENRARNFSNSAVIGSTTGFLSPLIAGFAIDHSGHVAACLYVLVFALITALGLVVWGGILPGAQHKPSSGGHVLETLAAPGIARVLITVTLVQIAQDLYQFYFPVYGHSIGLSASEIGRVLACFATATFCVRLVMSRLIRRLGEERLLTYCFYVAALGLVLIPFFKNPVALGMISFLFGLGMGCGFPITTMLLFARSPPGRSGETLGVRQTVSNIARISTPALFGFIASLFGLAPVFCINAVLMAGAGWASRTRTTARSDK